MRSLQWKLALEREPHELLARTSVYIIVKNMAWTTAGGPIPDPKGTVAGLILRGKTPISQVPAIF